MARWAEFAVQEPVTAELGERILSKYGMAYLGTVQANGWPRVHPISPVLLDGGLYIGIMPASPKGKDLERDGRCVIHTLPGPNDAEVSFSGVAVQLTDDAVEELIRQAPDNVRFARDTSIYEIQLDQVRCTTFENVGATKRPLPTRTRWTAETRV
jgi:pyridoxamine 5'-phosphate oxidase-like protein